MRKLRVHLKIPPPPYYLLTIHDNLRNNLRRNKIFSELWMWEFIPPDCPSGIFLGKPSRNLTINISEMLNLKFGMIMETREFRIEEMFFEEIDGHPCPMFETTIGPKAFGTLYYNNPIDCSTGKSFKEIHNSFRGKTLLEMLHSMIGRTFRMNVVD